jgi:hypothetical protein
VCIMPYRASAGCNYMYPLKLHEYLASGRPVVSSPVRSVLEFADVVALARRPDEWTDAIRAALEPGAYTAERRAARQAVARRHDWELLVGQIATVFAQRLEGDYAERLLRVIRTATATPTSRERDLSPAAADDVRRLPREVGGHTPDAETRPDL